MIKNLIFDMGNVLLSYEPDSYAGKLCSREAAPVILKELFRGPDWSKQDLGLVGKKELYELVSVRVPEEFHPDLWNVILRWSDLMRPLPGAQEFIRKMKERGFRLFVLSNAGLDFHEYFPKRYDTGLFDGIIVSCDLNVTKPDPRIYRHLLSEYGLTPEECVFADDLPENVAGAEKEGIHGFLFSGGYPALEAYIDSLM